MKDSYFIDVIKEINSLCSAIEKSKNIDYSKNATMDIKNFNGLFTKTKEEQTLKTYLMGLSDDTLDTICALMDFGRQYSWKILPINLSAKFNRLFLSYWVDKNSNDSKQMTVNYLFSKRPVLAKYLKRAAELLFYSTEKEIKLTHDCGGDLVEVNEERYLFDFWTEDDEYDEQDYELHLKCLKCEEHVTKIVDRRYFRQQI